MKFLPIFDRITSFPSSTLSAVPFFIRISPGIRYRYQKFKIVNYCAAEVKEKFYWYREYTHDCIVNSGAILLLRPVCAAVSMKQPWYDTMAHCSPPSSVRWISKRPTAKLRRKSDDLASWASARIRNNSTRLGRIAHKSQLPKMVALSPKLFIGES